jgi:hypothetical protein
MLMPSKVTQPAAVLLTTLIAGLGLAACSSSASTTTSGVPTSSTSGPSTTTLKTLPIPGAPSTDYTKELVAQGTGDRSLGTITVSGGRVFVQTVCSGPGSLEFVHLFAQGPCNDKTGVTSFDAPASHRLTITVHAATKTKWAVYISQEQ